MQQTALDWLISVDDHVLEPPDLWQKRLPVRYRDVGPELPPMTGAKRGSSRICARRRPQSSRRPAGKRSS